MTEEVKKEKVPMVQVRQTPPIKFKDHVGRNQVRFELKKVFGFIPEDIIIQKVQGRNNCIIVAAVIPPAILKKETVTAVKPKKV